MYINLLINKKINIKNIFICLFFILFFQNINLYSQNSDSEYRVYGTQTRLQYQKQENLLSFFEKEAYPGDLAYSKTIEEHGRERFCVNGTVIPEKQADILRIASFNVHNFHKICSHEGEIFKHPKYAVSEIGRINPDIVALQEVVPYATDEQSALNHLSQGLINVDFLILDQLMQRLNYVYNVKVNDFEKHPNINLKNIFMGKAIYTKENFPIKNFSNSQIGYSPIKDRGYLSILFDYKNKPILLYNVHLTFLNNILTKAEIDELLGFIEKDKEKFQTEYVIIIGDFNNNPYVTPDIFSSLEKSSYFLLNDSSPTSFNQNPDQGEVIDLIYVSQAFLNDFEILNQNSTQNQDKKVVVIKSDASDHWPIYFDCRLKNIPDGVKEQVKKTRQSDLFKSAQIDKSVEKIFDKLKRKIFKDTSPIISRRTYQAESFIPDVKLKEDPIALPIKPDIKTQSLSHIRFYKDTDVIDKSVIDQILYEARQSCIQYCLDEKIEFKELDMAYLSKLVLNVLDNEIQKQNDFYVFYHAHKPGYSFLFDFLQQIYRWGFLNKEQQLALRLVEFSGFAQEGFDDFIRLASSLQRDDDGFYRFNREKDKLFDLIPSVASVILSLNLSLFGNMQSVENSSFLLSLLGKSITDIKVENKLAQILIDLNIGQEFASKLLRLNQKYFDNKKHGVLLQFFVKKEVVDRFVYLSNEGGRPMTDNILPYVWDDAKNRIRVSSFLDYFINSPRQLNLVLNNFEDEDIRFLGKDLDMQDSFRYSINQIQARLYLLAKEVYDPRYVTIKRYNFDQDERNYTQYYKDLNKLIEDIIKDLIRKKLLNQMSKYAYLATSFAKFEQEILQDLGIEESKKISKRLKELGVEEKLASKKTKKTTLKTLKTELEDFFNNISKLSVIDEKTIKKIVDYLTLPFYSRDLKNLAKQQSPLIIAAKMSNPALVNIIFSIKKYNPEFNAVDFRGKTALFYANKNSLTLPGREVMLFLLDYILKNQIIIDNMNLDDLIILSKIKATRPLILEKFKEKFDNQDLSAINLAKALFIGLSRQELDVIEKKVFSSITNPESDNLKIIILNLLEVLFSKGLIFDSNLRDIALDFTLKLSENHVVQIQRKAIELQNIIGPIFLNDFYDREFLIDQSIQLNGIEELKQKIKKYIKAQNIDLKNLAINFLNLIVKNDRANEEILNQAFEGISIFVRSIEQFTLDQMSDSLELFQNLIYKSEDFPWYNQMVKQAFDTTKKAIIFIEPDILGKSLFIIQSLKGKVGINESDRLATAMNFIKVINENLIESDQKFESIERWDQISLLQNCSYVLSDLLRTRNREIFPIARKIIERTKFIASSSNFDDEEDAFIKQADDMLKVLDEEEAEAAATKNQALFKGYKERKKLQHEPVHRHRR